MAKRMLLLLLLAMLTVGCGRAPGPTLPAVPAMPTVDGGGQLPTEPSTDAVPQSVTPTATSLAPQPAMQSPTPVAEPTARPEQLAAAALLPDPPERDDVALAMTYRGASAAMATPAAGSNPVPGSTERFFIGNIDDNTVSEIEAFLLYVSRRAYFWFETGADVALPGPGELDAIGRQFDAFYDQVDGYFGDGAAAADERVHIIHAEPTTLCVTPPGGGCRLSGYFSLQDLAPRWANPFSNERPMFVMNSERFGTSRYLPVLGHELRHRIEAEYDEGDEDWVVEGSAMLAEDLLGYATEAQARGQLYLMNPDQQLNHWSDTDPAAHYGQGYLLSRYLFDRLGPALYRELSVSPLSGLAAVDAVAAAHGLETTGRAIWRDWLATMALVEVDDPLPPYDWRGPALERPMMTPVDSLPWTRQETVNQGAADYYELPSSGRYVVRFSGRPDVALLNEDPPATGAYWYAPRANYSSSRLTGSFDLSGLSSATLTYRAYVDIEYGYDFAYVSISADDGVTWQGLVGQGMQGLEVADDPSGSALTDRFYTGRGRGWIAERVDLSPWAGRLVQIRFEYVTDPILTYDGFALDDIAVPEIGFNDDGDGAAAGWTAEGFVRMPPRLAQEWYLQLITFDDDRPAVTAVPVGPDGVATVDVAAVAGEPRPVLVVAAAAPRTLSVATYTLEVR